MIMVSRYEPKMVIAIKWLAACDMTQILKGILLQMENKYIKK